jgi:hypothetical protein
MLTEDDRNNIRVRFTNRFRDKSFEGDLNADANETAELIQLDRRIKNLEADLHDTKQEMHIVKMAHRTVIDEQRVRTAKKSLGVRQIAEALLQEVYDRAQQVKKLRGEDLGWRSRRGGAYPAVRQFIKGGTYGNGYDKRDFHPIWVEKALLGDALVVLSEDTANKGHALYERVRKHYMKVMDEHVELGQPIDRGEYNESE